jgi:hypothetical protein
MNLREILLGTPQSQGLKASRIKLNYSAIYCLTKFPILTDTPSTYFELGEAHCRWCQYLRAQVARDFYRTPIQKSTCTRTNQPAKLVDNVSGKHFSSLRLANSFRV